MKGGKIIYEYKKHTTHTPHNSTPHNNRNHNHSSSNYNGEQ